MTAVDTARQRLCIFTQCRTALTNCGQSVFYFLTKAFQLISSATVIVLRCVIGQTKYRRPIYSHKYVIAKRRVHCRMWYVHRLRTSNSWNCCRKSHQRR